jgi:carnitine monooxygenase subunit
MSREQLVEIAKRNIAHARAGTVDQAPDVMRVPATNYHDPDRWRLEMDRIFRRVPLVMGFSPELPTAGSYKALEVLGVPVLLVRHSDGAVRAFVNMCSHRGAVIVEPGTGTTRRFTCPYHAWSYDESGDLVGILDRGDFGEVDTSCMGLTPLPVAERAGIIWASITPGGHIDIDAFLQGYDSVLELLAIERCFPVGTNVIPGPNWKVAYDGYVDFYHLPILHRDSFGPDMSSKASFDSWGPHQVVTSPSEKLAKWEHLPPEEWPAPALTGGVITIFPHISIATFDAGCRVYMVSQLFPGDDPDTSVTIQNFLSTVEPTDELLEGIRGTMGFLEHVVRDEDYLTGNRIQRSVKTGAKTHFVFGRNEGGAQRFHQWVQAIVDTDDADLPALFTAGPSPSPARP